MNIIRKLGTSLLDHIENSGKVSSDKITKIIQEYNEHKQKVNEAIERQRNMYTALYENPRVQNDMNYNAYLLERTELYNAWKKNGNKASMMQIMQLRKPELQTVPEIYTYTVINPYPREKRPATNQSPKPITNVKPKKTTIKPAKECPEGKVWNPATGRCINDPSLKAKKEPKEPKVPKEAKEAKVPKVPKATVPKIPKECPEGKILNPATGRCITDPNLKQKKTKK